MRQLLFSAIIIVVCIEGCEASITSKFKLDSDRLADLKRNLATPVAESDRPLYYEGEDIDVDFTVPVKTSIDSVKLYSRTHSAFITGELRIFKDSIELTDNLRKSGNDISNPAIPILMPGEDYSITINRHKHLVPGEYWGVLDIGILSEKFFFEVIQLPDSLYRMRELHEAIHAYPRRQYALQFGNGNFLDNLEYAKLLISLPSGTPLRMEGLRACTRNLPKFVIKRDIVSDTTTVIRALQEFLCEPRTHTRDAYFSIMAYFDYDYSRAGEMLQLVEAWGTEEMVAHLKEQFELQRENKKR